MSDSDRLAVRGGQGHTDEEIGCVGIFMWPLIMAGIVVASYAIWRAMT